MLAHSYGTQVASNNATNAATEGYTRRMARLEPIPGPPEPGLGARAVGQTRVIDTFVERRLLGARSMAAGAQAGSDLLARLDEVFGDDAGRLTDAFGGFQLALGDLAANPNDRGARTMVLDRAQNLALAFENAAGGIAEARAEANERIEAEVSAVNEKLARIGNLGKEIAKAEVSGHEASDLRDQRDQLLREVADVVPIKVIPQDDGGIHVLLAGSIPLVGPEGNVSPLATERDPTTGDVRITRNAAGSVDDVTARNTSGRIGGLLAARDGALTNARDQLDQLAYDVASAYNAAHGAGVGLDGVGGRSLFTPPTTVAGAAAALRLDPAVAGNPDAVAAGNGGATLPSDNRNALALVALADSKYALGGNATATEALAALTANAGSAVRTAKDRADQTHAQLDQVQALRESVSGVSTDEEMISLMQYQRAYQATLTVIRTADEMLQDLLRIKS
jgi:flagellar hook-associated protein 1 FlgK